MYPQSKHYVLGFMFSEDFQQVLLIRKLKPEWQKGFLNGIGGKIEFLEPAALAMVREFEEETGIKTKEKDWKLFCHMFRKIDFSCWCYYSIGDITKAKSMEAEQVEVIDISNGIPKDTLYNLNWLIPYCIDIDEREIIQVEYK